MKRILGIFLAIIMLLSTMCLTCSCVETFETEYKNLAYVEGKANGYEALDIYLPDDHGGPFPVLVFVHGGGWTENDRNVDVFNVDLIKELGFAVVRVDYTLTQKEWYGYETQYPLMIYDLKCAVRFLRANAEKYHLDTDTIIFFGESAGSHLSLLMGTTNGKEEYEDKSMGYADMSSDITAVVTLFAPTNLEDPSCDIGGYSRLLALACLGNDNTEEQRIAASPYYQCDENVVPTLLIHGKNDQLVPVKNSYIMEEKIREVAGDDRVETLYLDDGPHGDGAKFNSDEVKQTIFDFLKRHK